MLDEVVAALACPHCGRDLRRPDPRRLACARGHSFDVSRHGYVNLVGGGGTPVRGDTAEMIAARERVRAAGVLDPLVDVVATCAVAALEGDPPGVVVDVGAGTGAYLAACLDRLPARAGIAVDVSKHALRRAARCHRRAGAVGADAWRGLPLRDDAAALALSVFAPRGGAELARVLAPGGALVLARPTPAHLRELVEPLGLVGVDAGKEQRLSETLGSAFTEEHASGWEARLALSRDEVAALVAMGPSAFHHEPAAIADAVADWPEPVAATAAVRVTTHRRR